MDYWSHVIVPMPTINVHYFNPPPGWRIRNKWRVGRHRGRRMKRRARMQTTNRRTPHDSAISR